MGKLKRNKQNRKVNPIGHEKVDQDSKDENTRTQKIIPLIQKLTSSADNDRSMAISAISVLCEDSKFRKMLLKEKLVAIILEQCLNDSNDEIVVESFGLLRNLCIEEGYDVCMHLWRSNIWTTIEASLQKAEQSYKSLDSETQKVSQSKRQLLFDFTENLLSLIVVIASSSEELYDSIFGKIDYVLGFSVDLINWNVNDNTLKCSSRLFCTLLDFIYEFANESNEFIMKLGQTLNFNIMKLHDYILSKNLSNLSKVYVEGIRFHIQEAINTYSNKDKQTMVAQLLHNLTSTITRIDIQAANKTLEPVVQNNSIVAIEDSKERNQATSDFQAIEIALDLYAAMFEYLSSNEESADEPIKIQPDLSHLLSKDIFSCLYELTEFKDFKSKTLIALNNLLWLFLSRSSMPSEWFDKSNQLWDKIIHSMANDSTETQIESIGVLWAISKTLGPSLAPKLNQEIIDSLINKTNDMLQSNSDNELKIQLTVKSVGLLGCVAQIVSNTQATDQISNFLYDLISQSMKDSPEIVVECLNALFDIFGDKDYEYDYSIFVQKNWISKLESLQAKVTSMYKLIDKNKNLELKVKAEEANTNLGRFIAYKKQERL